MVFIVVADPEQRPCSNCERVEKELLALQQKNAKLEQQVSELQGYVFGRRAKSQEPPKTPGAKPGHPGWFRPVPKIVHRTEEVSLDTCPRCGSTDLSQCTEIEEHTQEDIVIPEPQVTLYRKHVYWCKSCGKKVRGRGKDELPGSPIGPITKSIANFLRYQIKVTQRDIAGVLNGLFGMKVSEAAVQGFHTQTRVLAKPLHDQLKEAIRSEPVVHADETGAPVNGNNDYCWLFASPRIALYDIHPSRGGGVVQSVLGKVFGGILSSDFYVGYNNSILAKAKQKCLVHLDRDFKKLLETFPPHDPVFLWAKRARDFFQEARAFYNRYHQGLLTRSQLTIHAQRFKRELFTLIHLDAEPSDIRRLSKRLLKHQNELLTFLDFPDQVSPDNNYAERLIRPVVIFRKLTGGFRSKTGTDNHDTLMSLKQTAQLNGIAPLHLFRTILTAQTKPLSLDICLGP